MDKLGQNLENDLPEETIDYWIEMSILIEEKNRSGNDKNEEEILLEYFINNIATNSQIYNEKCN